LDDAHNFENPCFRFFFYSSDRNEPIHVHVEKEECSAKIWIEPVRLEKSSEFTRKDINRILEIINENLEYLVRKWHEFFANGN
jgi:hypothetical protein